MRRTYIVIAILLLILGTASTFALTYVQTELEEPWGAQYTLQYTGASIELDNPETTRIDENTLEVQFDIIPDDKDVKCRFVITPLDINGHVIKAGLGGGSARAELNVVQGSAQAPKEKLYADIEVMELTYLMSSAARVDTLTLRWENPGFFAEYEGVRINIEDIE